LCPWVRYFSNAISHLVVK